MIVVLFVAAVFAGQFASTDPKATNPSVRLSSPSTEHYLGTDNLGRDIYSRVLHGARVTVTIGVGATIVATALAVAVGGASGFIGGRYDFFSQRLLDMAIAFPPLILLLSIVRFLPQPSEPMGIGPLELDVSVQKQIQLLAVLGTIVSFNASRVMRSASLSVSAQQFVEAAYASGASRSRVFFRHVLPNILPIIIVLATTYLGAVILIEASTSFLGVGLPPDVPSWGRMLSEGRGFVQRSLNITIWPGLAITLTVFAFNMLGDALRDELDPRLRGSR